MKPCHHPLAAGLLLLVVSGCQPSPAVPHDRQPDPSAALVPTPPLAPAPDGRVRDTGHVAPRDPEPTETTPYFDVTLDPEVRDQDVGVLSRADLDLLVATHPLVQQHLAAHPQQAMTLHERIDEALAQSSTPRLFFVAAGQRLAYPMTQIVSFRADALVKLPDGSLATQALVVSAPAVSFGVEPEPGLFLGLVSAPADVPVSLGAVDASVFWANGLRNPAWSAYWEGHQEILTSAAGVDLLLGNLGFQKLGPLELVVSGAVATVDDRALPRLLRAAPGDDVQPLWWQPEPAGAPTVLEAGDLRATLADGVLTLADDGEVLWARPVAETQLVALDPQAGRVTVMGAHATSVYRLAGTLEARFPFGAADGAALVPQDGYDPTSSCDNLLNLINTYRGYGLLYGMLGWAALAIYYQGWINYYTAIWQSMGCGQ